MKPTVASQINAGLKSTAKVVANYTAALSRERKPMKAERLQSLRTSADAHENYAYPPGQIAAMLREALDEIERLQKALDRKQTRDLKLVRMLAERHKAAELALSRVRELETAWQRGNIRECDNLGGTRSNRNVDVRVALEGAINTKGGD